MFSKNIDFFIIILIAAYAHGRPSSSNYENVTKPANCFKNYCFEMSPNYPTKLLDKILYDLDNMISEDTDSITKRIGESSGSDCEPLPRDDPIHEIVDENDRVRYVLQSKNFKQVIRVEECNRPGRLTSNSKHFTDAQLEVINLTCTEVFVDYSFLVLSLDGTKVESVKAKGGIPMYCACKLLSM